MIKKKFLHALLCLACTVVLTGFICTPALADYIHGYFRYTVADDSVTITAYTGNEEAVTIPAMIAGNPVNVIADGAFSDSSVKTVYLPDTIMSVEEGAFGTGQNVLSYVPGDEPQDSGAQDRETQNQEGQNPVTQDSEHQGVTGIFDDDGNFITVDDDGNLILVDKNGTESVLDDSQKYTAKADDSGKVVITDAKGNAVSVPARNGIGSIESADVTEDGSAISETPSTSSSDVKNTFDSANEEDQTQEKHHVVLPVIIVVIVVAAIVCGIVFARRRKDDH